MRIIAPTSFPQVEAALEAASGEPWRLASLQAQRGAPEADLTVTYTYPQRLKLRERSCGVRSSEP